jgi:hypothetical protein
MVIVVAQEVPRQGDDIKDKNEIKMRRGAWWFYTISDLNELIFSYDKTHTFPPAGTWVDII